MYYDGQEVEWKRSLMEKSHNKDDFELAEVVTNDMMSMRPMYYYFCLDAENHGLLDEAVTVFLVDEGKTVIRELRHLYQCPAEFSERKFPAIYKQYILADVYPVEDNWSSDKISWLQANLENREVEAVFRDMYQNVSYISPLDIEGVPLIVTLLAIGNVVTEKFSGLKFSSEKISSEADKIAAQSPFLTYSIMKIPLNSYEQCFVLNVEKGPWRFCLQFEQQREMLTQVNNKLQMYMHSKRLVKVYPKVGGTVVCEFMNHLYRGLVLKIKNQEVRVYCVDFGITLSKTSDEIWLLPEELLEIPVLTYTCCLYGLPDIPDGEISEEFSRLITDCPLIGRVIKYNQDLTTVSLFLNSLSLLSAPVQYDETVLPDKCKAVISYINEGSGTIYLQLVQNLKELKAMQEELQTHSIFKPLDHLVRKGLPCLALYPEDGLWYRGIVIDPGDPLMVQYVDHGNEGIVPAKFVKKLDLGMLKRLPAQAIPCILNSVTRKPLKRQDIHEVIGDDSVNVSLVDQTVVMVGDKNIKAYIVEMSNSTSVSVNKCLNQVESSKRICSYGIQEHNVVSDEVDEKGNSSLTSYTTNSNYRSSMKPPGIILLPHTKKECRLSWVESPSNFYVTLVENELTLEALRKA
nr:tudor domain-containing 6-like [Cherax quadricarinatus]